MAQNNNTHSLCLVLHDKDKSNYKIVKPTERILILKEGTIGEIDRFTSQYLCSKEIRLIFKDKITPFLKENEDYLIELYSANFERAGNIVVLESKETNFSVLKTIYGLDIEIAYALIENMDFMKKVAKTEYFNLINNGNCRFWISGLTCKEINYGNNYKKKVLLLKQWLERMQNPSHYYEAIRNLEKLAKNSGILESAKKIANQRINEAGKMIYHRKFFEKKNRSKAKGKLSLTCGEINYINEKQLKTNQHQLIEQPIAFQEAINQLQQLGYSDIETLTPGIDGSNDYFDLMFPEGYECSHDKEYTL